MIDLIYKLLGIRRAWLKDQQGAIRAYRMHTDPFGDYVTMRSTAGRFRVSLLQGGATDNATYPRVEVVMGGDLLDWLFENVFPWIMIALIAAVVLGVPVLGYMVYKSSKSPAISLRKTDWACTSSQRVPTTIYVQSGNVMIPMTTHTTVCNQWSKQP